MRFHLIDRIDHVVPAESIAARKLTSRLEPYWRDHGRGPEMPGALALEALCQAGSWLVLISTELRKRAALLSVDRVRLGPPIRPGDVLALDGVVESINADRAVLSGAVRTGGEVVVAAEALMCALVDTEDLESIEDVSRMRRGLERPDR
ncbi:3-hydroxylacyl-ACP dehydratase [Amycolatopsis anabasis]|uniref:3-hydroxylacyl-ACP dehydratase n=1 Tax=Amycolatopsis anabasis TaxID=1840409 RepID=UPI00131AF262|nr:3-hydroxylacyl-ACP dehydratase [Amycolatopsis anabasis]